jgi:hypothetical protein
VDGQPHGCALTHGVGDADHIAGRSVRPTRPRVETFAGILASPAVPGRVIAIAPITATGADAVARDTEDTWQFRTTGFVTYQVHIFSNGRPCRT